MDKEERNELAEFEKMKEKAKEFAETYYQPKQSDIETVKLNSAIMFAARFAIHTNKK